MNSSHPNDEETTVDTSKIAPTARRGGHRRPPPPCFRSRSDRARRRAEYNRAQDALSTGTGASDDMRLNKRQKTASDDEHRTGEVATAEPKQQDVVDQADSTDEPDKPDEPGQQGQHFQPHEPKKVDESQQPDTTNPPNDTAQQTQQDEPDRRGVSTRDDNLDDMFVPVPQQVTHKVALSEASAAGLSQSVSEAQPPSATKTSPAKEVTNEDMSLDEHVKNALLLSQKLSASFQAARDAVHEFRALAEEHQRASADVVAVLDKEQGAIDQRSEQIRSELHALVRRKEVVQQQSAVLKDKMEERKKFVSDVDTSFNTAAEPNGN